MWTLYRSYLPMAWNQLLHGLYQSVCWILYMYLFYKQTITELHRLNNHAPSFGNSNNFYWHLKIIYILHFCSISNKWYLYWYFIKLGSPNNNSKQSFYLRYTFFTMSIVKWNLTLIHTFQQFNFIPFLMLTTVLLQICLIEFESQLLSWKPDSKLIILFYIACTRVVPKLGRQVARHRKMKLVPQWVQVIGNLICHKHKIKINIKKWKL